MQVETALILISLMKRTIIRVYVQGVSKWNGQN